MKVFDLVNFLINNPCEDPEILKVILFIKKILEVAFIIVPIVLIVLITFDFIKSVTAGNEDTMKKNQKIVIKRLVYSVMLFFVIPIVNLVFSAFGTSENFELISDEFQGKKVSYLSCWDNAKNLETINKFEIVATFTSDGGKIFGGDEKDGKIQKSCGGSISCEITVPNATKKGYWFKGWRKSGDSRTYQVGQKVSINRNDEFVAEWEEKKDIKDDNVSNKEEGEKNENNPLDEGSQEKNDYSGLETLKSGKYTYPLYEDQFTSEKYDEIIYGTEPMSIGGCGVFSSAMLIAGLTNNLSVTPEYHVNKIEEYFPSTYSYYSDSVGSLYPGIWTSDFLEKTYGIESIDSDYGSPEQHLNQGYPIIAGIYGHMLAVIPAPENEKSKGNNIFVLDSTGKRTGPYVDSDDFYNTWGTELYYIYLLKPKS